MWCKMVKCKQLDSRCKTTSSNIRGYTMELALQLVELLLILELDLMTSLSNCWCCWLVPEDDCHLPFEPAPLLRLLDFDRPTWLLVAIMSLEPPLLWRNRLLLSFWYVTIPPRLRISDDGAIDMRLHNPSPSMITGIRKGGRRPVGRIKINWRWRQSIHIDWFRFSISNSVLSRSQKSSMEKG